MDDYLFTKENIKTELLKAALDEADFSYVREEIVLHCLTTTSYSKNSKVRLRLKNHVFYGDKGVFIIQDTVLHFSIISTITASNYWGDMNKSFKIVAHNELTHTFLKGISLSAHEQIEELTYKPKWNMITLNEIYNYQWEPIIAAIPILIGLIIFIGNAYL